MILLIISSVILDCRIIDSVNGMLDQGEQMNRKLSRRRFLLLAGSLILFSGCALLQHAPDRERCEVHFIAVGYGDAILVRQGSAVFFVDGGYPPVTPIILKHFRKTRIKKLDALIVTHPHPDHIGGAYGILQSGFPVGTVYSSYTLEDTSMPKGFVRLVNQKMANGEISYVTVKDGDRITLPGDVWFDVIHPENVVPDMNESSLVIHFQGIGNGVLLTGDIGIQSQERLLRVHPECFPVTLLKAPYHGGQSLEEFYRLANPDVTIVSDGVNPYGNPWVETLEYAKKWSSKTFRLSETGSIVVTGKPGGRITSIERMVP
jgi:competence protein ComEC